MGIRSPLEPVCSITLGSQAVTPLEMTDAYATLAARGIHHAPQPLAVGHAARRGDLLGTLEHPGRARAARDDRRPGHLRARRASSTHGTGVGARSARGPVAGKTGTAENFVDAWFCGYMPQLATCVWVGYPHKEVPMNYVEGVAGVTGGSLPAAIWHEFMT